MATISVKEAKHLEQLEKNLIEKFQQARKEEQRKPAISPLDPELELTLDSVRAPSNQQTKLNVSTAKHLERMNKKLKDSFADVYSKEIQIAREHEKKYEPITKAIKEQKGMEIEEKKTRMQERMKQLVKMRPRVMSTRKIEGNDDVHVSDEEPDPSLNESIKRLMDSNVINLGSMARRYLSISRDDSFGIWYDEATDQHKIGSEEITFDNNDIIFVSDNKKYSGTDGLWALLTKNSYLDKKAYSPEDWNAYKEILIRTNSLYHRNDPSTGRPKASQGTKWKRMIKHIWDELNTSTGSGLKLYSENPIEYKYINSLNEIINRLNYIYAQEAAGNNNFHNDKLAIVEFIHNRLEDLIKHPKGIKYLIRCLSALPESTIEGSGLLNDIINKLPFELHAPRSWNLSTYNYCGPGTKLNKRLARGDKGVNPLDEACKQHDIWYRDHTKAEDRWVADKALQKAAWQRVVSPDADLNERAVGLATTGGMWLKRKLGMGLGTSGFLYA